MIIVLTYPKYILKNNSHRNMNALIAPPLKYDTVLTGFYSSKILSLIINTSYQFININILKTYLNLS